MFALNLLNFSDLKILVLLIAIHTKFIEDNKAILRDLLDELIPAKLNGNESIFEKRFHLKYAQPEIRFRFLKPAKATYNDLSVPLNEFINHPIACKRIFIVENKMNFLTFPEVAEGLAIWGKGFAIESLRNARWLEDREIYYWSDLDVQGFQMLSQLKVNFPHAKSFLMESNLLDLYRNFVVPGTPSKIGIPDTLNENEIFIYNTLKSQNQRLEQERIPQWYVIEEVERLVGQNQPLMQVFQNLNFLMHHSMTSSKLHYWKDLIPLLNTLEVHQCRSTLVLSLNRMDRNPFYHVGCNLETYGT